MLIEYIAHKFPHLKLYLEQAQINKKPEGYIKSTIILSSIIILCIGISLALVLIKSQKSLFSLIFLLPLYFILFYFFMHTPKIKAKKRVNDIDSEVVYAGRYMLVELSAGIPLFNALVNVSQAYSKIGGHIQEIIRRVEVGKPLDTAINEVIEITPSSNFRKMMWQIMNSLRTGSDVSIALESIVEQISQEQVIEFKSYERKLNPLVMFYLMIAIILPSLGITMMALLSTFLGIQLNLGSLIGIAVFLAFIQFMFLNTIRNSRPGFAL
jgi:archaeal flagellar protein FlaJ